MASMMQVPLIGTYLVVNSIFLHGCSSTLNPEPPLQSSTTAPTTHERTEACPAECACQPGGSHNGGLPLVLGKCQDFCGEHYDGVRYCGNGDEYKTGDYIDCTGCQAYCVDTPSWHNNAGHGCASYESDLPSGWCANGAANPGQEWALGSRWNHPEENCCVCGKAQATNPIYSSDLCILPIGDSITQGERDYRGNPPSAFGTWRYELWKKLIDAGMTVDFVGSERSNCHLDGTELNYPKYRGKLFPQRNEGHCGWTADQILFHIRGIERYDGCMPSCVTVHVGTNDVMFAHDSRFPKPPVDTVVTETLRETKEIVNFIGQRYPSAKILVAKPIPVVPQTVWWPNQGTTTTEEDLKSMSGAMRDLGDAISNEFGTRSNVHVVDMFIGFSNADMTYDGIHPNRFGEHFMANRWRDAMIEHCAPPTA